MGYGNHTAINIWDCLFFILLILLSITVVILTILFIVGIITNPVVIPIIAGLSFISGLIVLGLLAIKVADMMFDFFNKKGKVSIITPVVIPQVPSNSPIDEKKENLEPVNAAIFAKEENYHQYLISNLSGLNGSMMGGGQPEPFSPEKISIIKAGKD